MVSSEFPKQILSAAQKHFSSTQIEKGLMFLKRSQVSVSFNKGTPETYFIVSGIIKEDRSHEAKIVYKKRLEDAGEQALSSNCDCHDWTQESHCRHSAALYLNFMLFNYFKDNPEEKEGLSDDVPLDASYAVSPPRFGTIINSPHRLKRAPSNSTYSSMQYLLTNQKVINFPLPSNFEGRVKLNIRTFEEYDIDESRMRLKYDLEFSHLLEEDEFKEISIFENIYLFNWKTGKAYHTSSELREFLRTLRIHQSSLDLNGVIRLVERSRLDKILDLYIDHKSIEDIEHLEPQCKVELNKSPKGRKIDFLVFFTNAENQYVEAPDYLKAFTFKGGELSGFKRKKDANEFLNFIALNNEELDENFKVKLYTSHNKAFWSELISDSFMQKEMNLYDPKEKVFYRYHYKFLRDLLSALYQSFGETFFRFSNYDDENKVLSYNVSSTNIFQGISNFYHKTLPYGIQIFYDSHEINRWTSKVRFERKQASTNWFDLELAISDYDLEILKNIDLDNSISFNEKGLTLLSKDQKDLIKFIKRYTQYESENKYRSEEGEDEDVNRFTLPFQRARIFELFELRKLGLDGALTEDEIQLCQKLETLEEMPEYELPGALQPILRPYQKTGYNWLKFLYENKFGACLADDMGLGKTLQTISFIQSIKDDIDKVLIVCPVTILLNWEKEFQKFSDLDVFIYHGGDRELPKETKVILTSYGIMKKEADEIFSSMNFDVFVLDEVQHLKNIRSLGAYAARKIKANFRICLTGTPVENDLSEFYNILDLSVPGVWGDLQFVRTTSSKKSRLLARKTVAPFILRRTKSQVLTELPPKIENNIYLRFSDKEQDDYFQHLKNVKTKIDQAPSRKKYGEILRGLLELRQKCLWQRRTHEADFPLIQSESSKMTFLLETLEQILEEGHQAIVFSQFTTYLDMIQKVLREKHYKLARIDGSQSMKKRQQQVDLFQSGNASVFLISLKAGGVGLNLTAASYVFIMDPWWNPAVESQAIDRAHRIGQQNTLTVYRPIIKGSVEEKVLELQKMKKQLFSDLLPDDEPQLFSGKLSMSDFEQLLS